MVYWLRAFDGELCSAYLPWPYHPHFMIHVFCGGAMALMAGILLYMGEGQVGVLQQFIVSTAIPVSVIILPILWTGPQAAMAREQKLL